MNAKLWIPLLAIFSWSLTGYTPLPTTSWKLDGTTKNGQPTTLDVKLPDWRQVALSNLPGILEDGSFNDNRWNQRAGYDLTRTWSAGDTPDRFLKLGDLSEALQPEALALSQIAQITKADLTKVSLASFKLAGEQTLEQLVKIVPNLGNLRVGDVPPIASLLQKIAPGISPSAQIADAIAGNPALSNAQLGQIDLSDFSIRSIPNLDAIALSKFHLWQNSFIKDIPGLGQVPLGMMPKSLTSVGNMVARLDVVYGTAEAAKANTISGSDVEGFAVPCRSNCAYAELDDLENAGKQQRGSFEGKQWISGKYQMVRGGHGALASVNGGLEPTGRHPFGSAFKVVVWEIDESSDKADTALFFRFCGTWVGCSPYFIGPVPFFSYSANAPIFVGEVTGRTVASTPTSIPSNNVPSLPSLTGTLPIAEKADNFNLTGFTAPTALVNGVDLDRLTAALADVESSNDPDLVGRLHHAVQSGQIDEWVASSFNQFLASKDAEKTVAGIMTNVSGTFSSFIQADILRCFLGTSTIPTFVSGRQIVIFKLDDARRSVIGPLLAAALHMTIVGSLSVKRSEPLIISLDELPSLRLDSLPQWINEYRSNGACFILGIQSLEQLANTYGENLSAAITSACRALRASRGKM
jgi:hypothetical protein